MKKNPELLRELTSEELRLASIFHHEIKGHTFEEYAFGLDCENEIADASAKIIDDAMLDAPEQIGYMDPLHDFDPDEVVKEIAKRDSIPEKAVYDAINLVYSIREYNDLHMRIYGIPGSVMLS